MRILLILLLLLYAVRSHAADEVLFIDLNLSPQEVKAAREAAEKSGRKLVVLPEIPAKALKEIEGARAAAKAAEKKRDKACVDESAPACATARASATALMDKQNELLRPFQLHQGKLAEFLASRKKGNTFSSVIISGHDGTGSFFGELGRLGDSEISEELAKYPEIKDSIRSLHLWGCYTTSPGSLLHNWNKHFPNTSLITGYEGRAPLNDKPAGWHYLKGVLSQEPELLKAADSAKLQKLLKKIPGANQVHSAIFSCDNYASIKEHFNIDDIQHQCGDLKAEVEKGGGEYECYLKASEERCANPPSDTAQGPVRKFYELLHKASACSAVSDEQVFRTYSRDEAIRLVYANQVQKNLGRVYGNELKEVDRMLEGMGAPAHLRFAEIGSISRRDMLLRAEELHKFLSGTQYDPDQDPAKITPSKRDGEVVALRIFQQNLTSTMTKLDSYCVPDNWIEPNRSEQSPCIQGKYLSKDGFSDLLADQATLKSHIFSGMKESLHNRYSAILGLPGQPISAQDQAKLHAIRGQILKINAYQNAGASPVPQEQLDLIAARDKYTATIQALADRGVKEPVMHPSAMRIAAQANKAKILANIEGTTSSIQSFEKTLRTDTSLSQNMRKNLAAIIEDITNTKAREEIALEASNLLASEAAWDGSMAQARRLNELKSALGRKLKEQKIRELERDIEDRRATIAGTGGSDSSAGLERQRQAIAEAEKEKQKAERASAAETRAEAERFLAQARMFE